MSNETKMMKNGQTVKLETGVIIRNIKKWSKTDPKWYGTLVEETKASDNMKKTKSHFHFHAGQVIAIIK